MQLHPFTKIAMVAALIAALIVYRELCIAMVGAYGTPSAIVVILACYAIARIIDRRERRNSIH